MVGKSVHVYLAGPITGCGVGEANDWRTDFAADLYPHGIVGVSPLRKQPVMGEVYAESYDDPTFGTLRAIAAKNEFDVDHCEMSLVYLPTPPEGRSQSMGTIIELAWTYKAGKRTILVSDDPKIMNHPLIDRCAAWKVRTLEEAKTILIGVCSIYAGE